MGNKKAQFWGSSQLLLDATALIVRNLRPRLQNETDYVCHFKGLIQFVKPSSLLISCMASLESQVSDQKQIDEPRRVARQVLWRVIAEYIPAMLSYDVTYKNVPIAKLILSWLLEEPQMLCFWNPDLNPAQASCCQVLGQLVSAGVKVFPEQKKEGADNLSEQENIEVGCSLEQEIAIELLVHRINSADPALANAASEALAAILMTFSSKERDDFILVLAKKVMQDSLPEDSKWSRCVLGIDIKAQDFARVVMPLLKAESAQVNRILYGTIARYLKDRVQRLKAGDELLDVALDLQVALAPAEQIVKVQQNDLRTTICSSAPEIAPVCDIVMSYCYIAPVSTLPRIAI